MRLKPDCDAFLIRARTYRGMGEYDKALADFDQSIRLDPMSAGLFLNRAGSLEFKKEHAKALHLVADCAKFCDLSADLIANQSPLMAHSCAACAEACKACAAECDKFDSPEYQEARKHRLGAADFHMVIIEGAA